MTKKSLIIMVGIGSIILFASGCAGTKQYVPMPDQSTRIEDPNAGRIYVFRPARVGGAVAMQIRDGSTHIGRTGPRGYVCWEREPGYAQIKGKAENTSTLELDVEEGVAYYILQKVRMGILFARNKLELISEDKAQKYLKKCKPAKVKL